jgi:hypothetical protein
LGYKTDELNYIGHSREGGNPVLSTISRIPDQAWNTGSVPGFLRRDCLGMHYL